MPYIDHYRRSGIDDGLDLVITRGPGELNYAITKLLTNYIDANGSGFENYVLINDILGALECAKQEFYRRVAVPYEDQKIEENGDVY